MKRNKTIDLLRFILSILIVPIHADLFKDVSTPLFWCFSLGLVRVGVPFFFIASGFFFRERVNQTNIRYKNNLKHLKLWLLFIVLDLMITGWFYYPNFDSIFAFLHKALFTGMSDAYWFIPTLVITQILLRPVFEKDNYYPAIIVGLIMYLFSMTHDSYSFLFEGTPVYTLSELHTKIFIFPQCGLVESVFFLSLGGLISKEKNKLGNALKDKTSPLAAMVGVFCVLLMIEAYYTQNNGAYDGNCYLTLIALPALLFIWALIADPVSFPTKKLGEMALYIYLIHPIFVSIFRMFGADSIVRTFGAITIAIIISYVIIDFSATRRKE